MEMITNHENIRNDKQTKRQNEDDQFFCECAHNSVLVYARFDASETESE